MKTDLHIELDEGLGDNIICMGLLCYLQTKHNVIVRIPAAQEKNRITYESFFDGTGIQLMPEGETAYFITPALMHDGKIIKPAKKPLQNHQWKKLAAEPWLRGAYPTGFYSAFGIKYEDRLKYCNLREQADRVEQLPYDEYEYVFVHDDSSREFNISENTHRSPRLYSIIKPSFDEYYSVLQYRNIIENALEIHCIDSSFFHLVNSLKPKGKLFYHRYARPRSHEYKMHPEWKTLW